MDDEGPERRRSPWRTLEHRDFRLYFAGNATSNLGSWFQTTAQVVLAYRLSGGSAFAVGLVAFVEFFGALVLWPLTGMLADRLDRRRLLVGTQVMAFGAAGGLAVLEFMGALSYPWLLVGALLIGLSWTFSFPAFSALIPSLVPSDDVKSAMTLNTVSNNVGRALGPVLGVVVIALSGFKWVFFGNAISFAVIVVALLAVKADTSVRQPERPRVRDTFRIVGVKRDVWLVVAVAGLVTFTIDPFTVLGPALATKLGWPDNWSGWFLTALGVGMVLGSLKPRSGRLWRRGVAWYVALLAVSVVVFVVSPWWLLSIAAALVAGAASLLALSNAQAFLLKEVNPAEYGRVMAVWTMAFAGSRPIASIIDGWLAVHIGPSWAGVIIALPALVASLPFVFSAPGRRRLAEYVPRRVMFVPSAAATTNAIAIKHAATGASATFESVGMAHGSSGLGLGRGAPTDGK
jgi:MFS family permease